MLDGLEVDAGVVRRQGDAHRRFFRPLQVAPALGDLPTRDVCGVPEYGVLELRPVEPPRVPVSLQGHERLIETWKPDPS